MTKTLGPICINKGTSRVGDVEVPTAIRVPTPEHDRLVEIRDKSQAIGAFLDWLFNEREPPLTLCVREAGDNYCWEPVRTPITRLLAEYFAIDEQKLDDEKRALLEAIRR